jgi:DNA-binding XRE family transcriptional regulator
MSFAEEFRAAREELGISQAKAAVRLSVTYQTIYRWEAGEGLPSEKIAKRVKQVFNITVNRKDAPKQMSYLNKRLTSIDEQLSRILSLLEGDSK